MGTYVVTGGAGALGRAVCAELVVRGHAVALIDLAPAPSGFHGLALTGVDLGDERAVVSAFDAAAAEMGPLDGLVNVAGGFVWETVTGGSIASWDDMYRINLRTAALSCRASLEHLRDGGAIVNVGAAAALKAASGMAPYAASKAGVMALTEALADELQGRRIRVNAVLPTIIDTPANRKDMPNADFGEWVCPERAAKAIALLLSEDARSISGSGIRLSLGG